MRSDLKYSHPLRTFHWLVALAVLIAVAVIEVLDFSPRSNAGRVALFMLHQAAGLSVPALMVPRLLAQVATQVPSPVPSTPPIQLVARLTHGVLYALMVGMSLLDLLALAWGGKPIQPFKLDLPLVVTQDKTLVHLAKKVRESGVTLVYIAVGLHAAVAPQHESIPKDRLLHHMIQRT